MNLSFLLPCAGSGSRFGADRNKLFLKHNGIYLLQFTLNALDRWFTERQKNNSCSDTFEIVLVHALVDEPFLRELKSKLPIRFVAGGKTRSASVRLGLEQCNGDIVLVHDGARPFVTPSLIDRCLQSVFEHGSGVPALPMTDSVKRLLPDGSVVSEDRSALVTVQTPQGFWRNDLLSAYEQSREDDTDDAQVMTRAGFLIHLFPGEEENQKITYPSDLRFLEKPRIGRGHDIHPLVPGRKLILGGVEIPYERGLDGHSDADVLIHAVMDAMLSAAGLRDIGTYFPNTDPAYSGISSLLLLARVRELVQEQGFRIANLSANLICERPKLRDFIPSMIRNLSQALSLPESEIGITAGTNEGLGFLGEGKGICALAVCLLLPDNTKTGSPT